MLVVVGLLCQYHRQVAGWKDSSIRCVEWNVKLYTLTHSVIIIIIIMVLVIE